MIQYSCSHGGVYTVSPRSVRVDFSSNINPIGISSNVLDVLRKNLPKLSSIYPDDENTILKKKNYRLFGWRDILRIIKHR